MHCEIDRARFNVIGDGFL